MSTTRQVEIRRLGAAEVHAHLDGLAAVLADCVAGGASVSYLAPFSHADARAAFEAVAAEVDQGRRLVLAAFADGDLLGTVQVFLALPPNQPHRAEDREAPRSPLSTHARHCPTSRGACRSRGANYPRPCDTTIFSKAL